MSLNFTQMFKEEKDIYIQNLANGQVSLQFGRGDEAISFLLTRKRDPIVLTNHVPFKTVAASTDFRKILNRHPAVVKLLTEEEYKDYYKVKAKTSKTTIDQAIAQAESERLGAKASVEPVKSTAPKDDETVAETPEAQETDVGVSAEDVINGRVIHLCHQSSPEIPVADRMKPAELLEKFKELQSEFKMDDFDYILAHTNNKSIHTWVKTCQKTLVGV
jgi:hypothetical protein